MPLRALRGAFSLFCFLFLILPSQAQLRMDLRDHWEFRESGGKDWLSAQVPGTVHTDLLAAGLIPDPFSANNAAQLQWIEQLDWEYRTTIQLSELQLQHGQVDLVFEGLDTYAEVFVNQQWVGRADNMHRTWRFPCKPYLHAGPNAILVRFKSVMHQASGLHAAMPFPLPAGNDVGNPKLAPFVRKAAYHFGWDFAPRLLGVGIWRPAYLEAWTGARIASVQALPLQLGGTSVPIRMVAQLDVAVSDDYQVDIFQDGLLVVSTQRTLEHGLRTVELQFSIQDPKYWWPRSMGQPDLYMLTTEIRRGRTKLSSREQALGLRQVRLVIEPDSIGTSFYFAINEFDKEHGGPLYIKGANYVPADVFLPRGQQRQAQLLQSAEAVGMNMLRVWGGGVFEDDAFYDWCDRHGMLVWQDLPFACMMYPLAGEFLSNVQQELRDNVGRLRHHPSLALWCGNNEIEVAWKNWGWQVEGNYSPEFAADLWKQYTSFFEGDVPNQLAMMDPTRSYIPTSPLSNWGKEENFRHKNMHYWGVWHGSDSLDGFARYVPRFMAEYGFQSWPSAGLLSKYLPGETPTTDHPGIIHRQKSYKGNAPITRFLQARYGEPRDFPTFCYLSQLLQRDAMELAITAHRMAQPRCMGTLYWQLNDVWPGPSWSTLEYDGRWKAAHYALVRLYAPELYSIRLVGNEVAIAIASELPPRSCNMQLRLKNFEGEVFGDYQTTLHLRPGAKEYLRIPLASISSRVDPASQFLELVLHQGRNVIGRTHCFLAPPSALRLPDPAFSYTVSYNQQEKYFDLLLQARSLVKDLEIQAVGTDARMEENFFDLLPGTERHIRIWAKDLLDPAALSPLLRFRDLGHMLAQ